VAAVKYCVIGRHGLIGSALARKLGEVTSYPVPDTRVVFHFGSYVHMDFERNPEHHMKQAIDSYTSLLPYCRQHGILFVYPSSALTYEKDTQFSRFKKAMEQLVGCYDVRTLGLRIFPTYGPGESRTVISQWCRQMLNGERPVVFGDGNQSRDFIYADDAAEQIVAAAECSPAGQHSLADIGCGYRTKFKDIVAAINRELGTAIEPRYVPAPPEYSEGIVCERPAASSRVSIEGGVRRILCHLRASAR
jgi:nucleoside-diphosphate-sugar epimerase